MALPTDYEDAVTPTGALTELPATGTRGINAFAAAINAAYASGGTDVAVADGGTGASTATDARTNLGVAYGSIAGTVCEGNDSRLSDARTPTAHNQSLSTITDVTATAAEVNVLDGITSSTAELNILDGVTATAAEINALDGITSTVTELNALDGIATTKAVGGSVNGTATSLVLWTGTAAQYAAVDPKDTSTVYIVTA